MKLKDKLKDAFLEEERNVEMLRRIEKIDEDFAIDFYD